MSDIDSSEDSTSDPPTPPPRRQKASSSTGKHKGARTHKVKEGEGKGKGKKRREPSPSSASSGSDSNSPDHHHKSTKECVKKQQKIHSKKAKSSRKTDPLSREGRSHLDVFQCHFRVLVSSISSCLNTVATELYSRKLISDEVLSGVLSCQGTEKNMASKLLLCMKRNIDSNPAVLLEFIDVLKEEPSCDGITKKITSELE